MSSLLTRFNLCEICKKPISDNSLCFDCNKLRKKAQEYAIEADATTKEVSEKFGISEKLLIKWVKEGDFWCKAPCRCCGKMVKGAIICDDCRFKFATELKR